MVCGRNCFYVFDKDTTVLTAGTKRGVQEVQDLVYKTYKWVLDNRTSLFNFDFVNHFIETGISIYKMEAPSLLINVGRNRSYAEELFEYISLKFKLFGYVFVEPCEAVLC